MELQSLRDENEELRRRVDAANALIQQLRFEAIARRSEVRALAEAFPAAMSRHALVRQMTSDVVHHPDKVGVLRRAIAKLGRAPRKLLRMVRGEAT